MLWLHPLAGSTSACFLFLLLVLSPSPSSRRRERTVPGCSLQASFGVSLGGDGFRTHVSRMPCMLSSLRTSALSLLPASAMYPRPPFSLKY